MQVRQASWLLIIKIVAECAGNHSDNTGAVGAHHPRRVGWHIAELLDGGGHQFGRLRPHIGIPVDDPTDCLGRHTGFLSHVIDCRHDELMNISTSCHDDIGVIICRIKNDIGVIHSFRHSLRDRLRAVKCPSKIVDQIDG